MINKFKRLSDRLTFLFSSTDSLRKRWPKASMLQEQHLQNCKMVTDRWKMLENIPQGGICAEVGIWKCDFSEDIMETVKPEKLHLIDIDPESIKIAKTKFDPEIRGGRVVVHHQDSSKTLSSMGENYFDWIYIDGDHNYDGVKKDLNAAHKVLKKNGLISLNDYIFFGSSDMCKYGVIEAVNEFCLQQNYEILYFALQGRMYNDVTLRKITE